MCHFHLRVKINLRSSPKEKTSICVHFIDLLLVVNDIESEILDVVDEIKLLVLRRRKKTRRSKNEKKTPKCSFFYVSVSVSTEIFTLNVHSLSSFAYFEVSGVSICCSSRSKEEEDDDDDDHEKKNVFVFKIESKNLSSLKTPSIHFFSHFDSFNCSD